MKVSDLKKALEGHGDDDSVFLLVNGLLEVPKAVYRSDLNIRTLLISCTTATLGMSVGSWLLKSKQSDREHDTDNRPGVVDGEALKELLDVPDDPVTAKASVNPARPVDRISRAVALAFLQKNLAERREIKALLLNPDPRNVQAIRIIKTKNTYCKDTRYLMHCQLSFGGQSVHAVTYYFKYLEFARVNRTFYFGNIVDATSAFEDLHRRLYDLDDKSVLLSEQAGVITIPEWADCAEIRSWLISQINDETTGH